MKLSSEEVEHIARLARLGLTDEEKEIFREQLSEILNYFAHLQNLDTEGIPPTFSVLQTKGIFRLDEPKQSLTREELLSNAADVESNQFRVPAILE